ncbi:MAG: Fur family transcriptional regulator [Persicimonas sp.]
MTKRADIDPAEPGQANLLDRGLDRLRESGCRLTPQRKAILEVFGGQPEHLTPQQVFSKLEDAVSSLSLATVYNTLELFEEVGLVKRLHAHDGQTYFEPTAEDHHHAVCDKCGGIFDVHIEPDSLDQLISATRTLHGAESQFEVEQADVWLRGVCAPCRG